MMRTPDEIKKELNSPIPVHFHIGDPEPRLTPIALHDLEFLHADALAIIKQLEAELEDMTARYKIADDCAKKKGEMNEKLYAELAAVKAERDAAVTFLPRKCYLCKHVGNKMGDAPCPSFCEYITLEECPNWQWHGVQKEDGNENT